MKKNIFLICCLISISIPAQEIKFEQSSWADIKAKAKKENKLIFIDAYTVWCGPCKAMAKNVFTNKEVADFYNANFINAKFDMEKGEGPQIAKLYEVSCYPNLLYIDGDGKLIHRAGGSREASQFIELGETAQSTDKTFSIMHVKYTAGNNDPAFISEYLKALSECCLSSNNAALKYFEGLKEGELLLKGNWDIFNNYVEDISSEPFVYFLNNRKQFAEKHTDQLVNNKIYACYLTRAYQYIYGKKMDEPAISKLKSDIDKVSFTRGEELNLDIDESCFLKKKDWISYFKTTKLLVEKYRKDDSNYLNNVSYTLFENSNNKTHLIEAEKWAKCSVDLKAESANLDTYASLLNKNGKKKEAIEMQKKAIALGKANGEDTSGLEKTLMGFENKNG